jgi:two-component system response regulator
MYARPDIWIVEDDRYSLKLMIEALTPHGVLHRIKIFQDGSALLNHLFSTRKPSGHHAHHEPKVIVLDLKMPTVNNLEVLKRIRSSERTKMTPTVIFTSSTDDRDKFESYKFGANIYVVKPSEHDRFLSAITGIVLYWSLQNDPPYQLKQVVNE